MEQKTIIKCFIASPGDTKNEREVCEKVFNEINKGIGESCGIRLESLRWENDVYPGIGEDGQDVINKQIRGKYDLFIGIMNKRFGTPTKREESGTVEEFNDAYRRACDSQNMEIMFYFNGTEPDPSTIDQTEYKKVKSFRDNVVSKKCLYGIYNNIDDFEDKLRKHLNLYVAAFSKSEKKVYPKSNIEVTKEGERLKKYLDNLNFRTTGLPDDLSKNQGIVIWPIKLLLKITYIHKAQVQLIKLLTDLNWKLLVIIGDCGIPLQPNKAALFKKSIKDLLDSEKIPTSDYSIDTLSHYYKPKAPNSVTDSNTISKDNITADRILGEFHDISDGLVWDQFDQLIKKSYSPSKTKEIDRRTVLHNIQPLLVWSLVATIANGQLPSKSIVIAGEDESKQWDYILGRINSLGVIFIHELKGKDGNTMDQEDIKIGSPYEMSSKLDNGNMAEWLFTHFVGLPQFKNTERPSFCKLSEHNCIDYNHNCLHCLFDGGDNFHNKDFDRKAFVDYIYPKANIANI